MDFFPRLRLGEMDEQPTEQVMAISCRCRRSCDKRIRGTTVGRIPTHWYYFVKVQQIVSGNCGTQNRRVLKKGQITMDIDFKWGGDPSIILAVEAALVAPIPIQLKDLQVFTVVRVSFQLAEEIPCISSVVVALLSEPKPRIDYTLKAVKFNCSSGHF